MSDKKERSIWEQIFVNVVVGVVVALVVGTSAPWWVNRFFSSKPVVSLSPTAQPTIPQPTITTTPDVVSSPIPQPSPETSPSPVTSSSAQSPSPSPPSKEDECRTQASYGAAVLPQKDGFVIFGGVYIRRTDFINHMTCLCLNRSRESVCPLPEYW